MKQKHLKLFIIIISLLIILMAQISAGEFKPRKIAIKPEKSIVGQYFDRNHVEVKFIDDLDIGLSANGVPVDRMNQSLKSSQVQLFLSNTVTEGGSWRRMAGGAESTMDEFRATAMFKLNRGIADLNNYFILTVPEGIETEVWLDKLNSLDEVEIALALPLPMVPPIPPDFEPSQGYLLPAPNGLDFHIAWAHPGGDGWSPTAQTLIVDLEYSWNLSHNDLGMINYVCNPSLTPQDPFSDNNHGTAVAGEIHGFLDGIGVTGGCHQSLMWAAPTNFTSGWDIGAAMTYCMTLMNPGDIFLIEQQMAGPNYPGPGPQDGLVPVEWWASWYNVILTAIGNGIHVVEAAGNGQEDLDAPIYSMLNGGHWPFIPGNHSGAIIVGAGASPAGFGGTDTDRSRLWFSNYGSRVDLQGWGENVVTTGYGDYYSSDGVNYWYTSSFGGTSSASPMIAAAVGSLHLIYYSIYGGSLLDPASMLALLTSTGSPQQSGFYPASQNIGPRPDIALAIAAFPTGCCNMRGDVNDDNTFGISDLTYLVDFMFNSGPPPPCNDEGDVNNDGSIGISDITYFVGYLFQSGPPPPPC